jgi:hypothetical protein
MSTLPRKINSALPMFTNIKNLSFYFTMIYSLKEMRDVIFKSWKIQIRSVKLIVFYKKHDKEKSVIK